MTRPDAHVPLGSGGEFDVVRRLLGRWGALASGIGDDAALLPAQQPGNIVVSTDSSVEDVHFRKAWLAHREIGYRATAAALSDLAAMAATPMGVLVALTLPENDVVRVEELADGIGDCVREAGTRILGGDITRGAALSLTLTVIGAAERPLTRSGAAPGDRVYVTGRLGGPAGALRDFRGGREPRAELRARFAHPVPRLRESRWLAEHGCAAAIDISDGLVADARHLAAASGVAVEIRSESVPLFEGVPLEWALSSGEEYELLVTSAAALDEAAFSRELGLELTEIGKVEPGEPGTVVLKQRGRAVAAPGGYDHFGGA